VPIVGILPAAGYARRLQPIARSKEMLIVRERPIMDHLVSCMKAARADELRVVTRHEKQDVAKHARAAGATVIFGNPATVAESLALGLAGLSGSTVALIGFPDTLFTPPDAFVQLVAELRSADAVLGLFHSPEAERGDVVDFRDGRVLGVEPKPTAPRTDLIWSLLVARASALQGVAESREPGDLLDRLARSGRVAGVDLGSDFIDIGVPASLAAARRPAEEAWR